MTNSEKSTSHWIGSTSDDPDMFLRFTGLEAEVLTYVAAPHRTAIIAIKGLSPGGDMFAVLHGCRMFMMPVSWTVGCLSVRREDPDTIVLSDSECNVDVYFYAGRLCSRNDAIAYFGESIFLRQLISEFHSS